MPALLIKAPSVAPARRSETKVAAAWMPPSSVTSNTSGTNMPGSFSPSSSLAILSASTCFLTLQHRLKPSAPHAWRAQRARGRLEGPARLQRPGFTCSEAVSVFDELGKTGSPPKDGEVTGEELV